MIDCFAEWDWVPSVLKLLNSSFVSTLIGALAGAFFGALAATRFAARQERQREKLQDLRKNNSCVIFSTSIANDCLAFKRQITRDMVERFEEDKLKFTDFVSMGGADQAKKEFRFDFDFQSIKFFRHEADELRKIRVNDLSVDPKITTAAIHLWQSLNSLDHSISQRELDITRLSKLKSELTDDEMAKIYFGLETKSGHVDTRFSDTIISIKELLDSAIFFSMFVTEELSKRGQEIKKTLGKSSEKAFSGNFDNIKDPSLLPDRGEFKDWM